MQNFQEIHRILKHFSTENVNYNNNYRTIYGNSNRNTCAGKGFAPLDGSGRPTPLQSRQEGPKTAITQPGEVFILPLPYSRLRGPVTAS